jgi:hypothetical protein
LIANSGNLLLWELVWDVMREAEVEQKRKQDELANQQKQGKTT